MTTPRLSPAAIAASLAVAGAAVLTLSTHPGPAGKVVQPAWLPDPTKCPGEIVPGITRADTCDPGYAKRVRDVPESVKRAVFRRDGIPWERHSGFEVDHRVPLSIGGSNELANLTTEAWDGPFNAHMKDRLEFAMFKAVCRGEVDIKAAQGVFMGDWSSEYVRRFGPPDKPKFGAAPGADDDEPIGDAEGFPIAP